jgi:lipid-binding SYLF domain-containing protein
MTRSLFRSTIVAAVTAVTVTAIAPAYAQSDQQKLVDAADTTFSNFVRDPDMTWFQQNVGGSGGRAVLVAKDPKSAKWVGPAFYTLATGSVGFQAGIAVSEAVTLVMTDKGMNSLLASSFKMGGDASVAAGPVGAGAKSDVVADLVTFSRSKGVYGGLNLDGTVIAVSNDWNKAYFGKDVLPPDILIRMSVHNKQADPLLASVTKASKGK